MQDEVLWEINCYEAERSGIQRLLEISNALWKQDMVLGSE